MPTLNWVNRSAAEPGSMSTDGSLATLNQTSINTSDIRLIKKYRSMMNLSAVGAITGGWFAFSGDSLMLSLEIVAIGILLSGIIAVYFCFGKLAKLLGRNWIVWVGLTLLACLLGLLVRIISMNMNVREAIVSATLFGLETVALGLLLSGIIAVYFCFGKLAKLLGRNWMVWVGLTLLTGLFGLLVGLIAMNMNAREALVSATLEVH